MATDTEQILTAIQSLAQINAQTQDEYLRQIERELRQERELRIRMEERVRVQGEALEKYHVRLGRTEDESGKSAVRIDIIDSNLNFIKKFIDGDGNGNKGARIILDRVIQWLDNRTGSEKIFIGWLSGISIALIMFALNLFFGG